MLHSVDSRSMHLPYTELCCRDMGEIISSLFRSWYFSSDHGGLLINIHWMKWKVPFSVVLNKYHIFSSPNCSILGSHFHEFAVDVQSEISITLPK